MALSLITGGTSGLGAAFSRALAAEGSDLILVARDGERLETVAGELRGKHSVAVETVVADLATKKGVALVEKLLSDRKRPVDLLINNAGFGLKGGFLEVSADDHSRMLDVNSGAVLRLTHAALKQMVERNSGGVINISSVAGFTPAIRPSSTYAATKAFVTAMTEGLAPSLSGTNVRLTAVCPGWVRTEFHERAGIKMSKLPKSMWLDADDVAKTALKDHRAGRVLSIPSAQYKAIVIGSRLVPRWVAHLVSKLVKERIH